MPFAIITDSASNLNEEQLLLIQPQILTKNGSFAVRVLTL